MKIVLTFVALISCCLIAYGFNWYQEEIRWTSSCEASLTRQGVQVAKNVTENEGRLPAALTELTSEMEVCPKTGNLYRYKRNKEAALYVEDRCDFVLTCPSVHYDKSFSAISLEYSGVNTSIQRKTVTSGVATRN